MQAKYLLSAYFTFVSLLIRSHTTLKAGIIKDLTRDFAVANPIVFDFITTLGAKLTTVQYFVFTQIFKQIVFLARGTNISKTNFNRRLCKNICFITERKCPL